MGVIDVVPGKRPTLSKADLVLGARGIVVGETACVACGRRAEVEDYPATNCPCGAPLQSRCVSCGAVALPRKDALGWIEPWAMCEGCCRQDASNFRMQRLSSVVPSDAAGYVDYMSVSHRTMADAIIDRWVRSGCGRNTDQALATPILYLMGQTGSGKSTAAAMAAKKAYAERMVVSTMSWVSEEHLISVHSNQWGASGDQELQKLSAEAKKAIQEVKDVDLLVLDEFLGRPSYTNSFVSFLTDILTVRIERMRPTIITSNRDPDLVHFGFSERIADRLENRSVTVVITGRNMRHDVREMRKAERSDRLRTSEARTR